MTEPHILVGWVPSDAPPPTLNLEVHPLGMPLTLKSKLSSSHSDSLKFGIAVD